MNKLDLFAGRIEVGKTCLDNKLILKKLPNRDALTICIHGKHYGISLVSLDSLKEVFIQSNYLDNFEPLDTASAKYLVEASLYSVIAYYVNSLDKLSLEFNSLSDKDYEVLNCYLSDEIRNAVNYFSSEKDLPRCDVPDEVLYQDSLCRLFVEDNILKVSIDNGVKILPPSLIPLLHSKFKNDLIDLIIRYETCTSIGFNFKKLVRKFPDCNALKFTEPMKPMGFFS